MNISKWAKEQKTSPHFSGLSHTGARTISSFCGGDSQQLTKQARRRTYRGPIYILGKGEETNLRGTVMNDAISGISGISDISDTGPFIFFYLGPITITLFVILRNSVLYLVPSLTDTTAHCCALTDYISILSFAY